MLRHDALRAELYPRGEDGRWQFLAFTAPGDAVSHPLSGCPCGLGGRVCARARLAWLRRSWSVDFRLCSLFENRHLTPVPRSFPRVSLDCLYGHVSLAKVRTRHIWKTEPRQEF